MERRENNLWKRILSILNNSSNKIVYGLRKNDKWKKAVLVSTAGSNNIRISVHCVVE